MVAVTILLRTLNPGADLPVLLDRLHEQDHPITEILMVDSGSRDGSVALARERGVRIVDLEPARFTHALSTNLGFREARGEVVAMLSQDALPTSPGWLAALVQPLEEPGTAAVFGRQLPRPRCFPLERWELERCYPSDPPPGVPYSNVNSAARRAVWDEEPFDETLFIAEDAVWADRVRARGHRVAYAPEAAVIHSHEYTLRQAYARCRDEARTRRQGGDPAEGMRLLLLGWPKQTVSDLRRLAAEGRGTLWPRAAAYRFAQFAGIIAGGRP